MANPVLNADATTVKVPVMPRGVEHSVQGTEISVPLGVKVPVMPRGVEHTAKLRTGHRGYHL